MTIETVTLTAPSDTQFTVQADAEWFGRYFAAAPSDEQAEMIASMVRPAAGCVNHPNRPIRENLDGDDLCQECCDNWARGEGDFGQ